jgi:hypothetical protein
VQARRHAPDLKTGGMAVALDGSAALVPPTAAQGLAWLGLVVTTIGFVAWLVVGAGIVLGLGGPGRPRRATPRPSG